MTNQETTKEIDTSQEPMTDYLTRTFKLSDVALCNKLYQAKRIIEHAQMHLVETGYRDAAKDYQDALDRIDDLLEYFE